MASGKSIGIEGVGALAVTLIAAGAAGLGAPWWVWAVVLAVGVLLGVITCLQWIKRKRDGSAKNQQPSSVEPQSAEDGSFTAATATPNERISIKVTPVITSRLVSPSEPGVYLWAIHLQILNSRASADFTAEVVRVVSDQGPGFPCRQEWPIPWLGFPPGDLRQTIFQGEKRTLEFAEWNYAAFDHQTFTRTYLQDLTPWRFYSHPSDVTDVGFSPYTCLSICQPEK